MNNLENNLLIAAKIESDLQYDLIAYKKVVKWTRNIQKRIERNLQKLDQIEKLTKQESCSELQAKSLTKGCEYGDSTVSDNRIKKTNQQEKIKQNVNQSEHKIKQQSLNDSNKRLPAIDEYKIKKVEDIRNTKFLDRSNSNKTRQPMTKQEQDQNNNSSSIKPNEIDGSKIEELIKTIVSDQYSHYLNTFKSRLECLENTCARHIENESSKIKKLNSVVSELDGLKSNVSDMCLSIKNVALDQSEKERETKNQLECILRLMLGTQKT
jgi:hypothetical protein